MEVWQGRDYAFGDILVERAGTRQCAGAAVRRGQVVEDEVEKVVQKLALSYQLRTRFEGRNNRGAPADLVIPGGGAEARIVCAAKGFDSTGSKFTDAVREIESMADVRLPTQFVFAVVDGIGWLNRQSDLRRIHELWIQRSIDGLFSLATLGNFQTELEDAVERLMLR